MSTLGHPPALSRGLICICGRTESPNKHETTHFRLYRNGWFLRKECATALVVTMNSKIACQYISSLHTISNAHWRMLFIRHTHAIRFDALSCSVTP